MTWMEVGSEVPEHLPQNIREGLKSEATLLEFCRKIPRRFSSEIAKTIENMRPSIKGYTKYLKIPNYLVPKITDLPGKDQHMVHLQDRLQEDAEYTRKKEYFNEEDINHLLGRLLSMLTS